MCINDWRAGRLVRHTITTGDLSVAAITIPANQQRVGLFFSPTTTLTAAGIVGIAVDGIATFIISGFAPLLHLSLDRHGDLPTRKFTVSSIASVSGFAVVEFFMPESYLAAGLEQFVSEYAREHSFARP
jgi:hypothetical protein